MKDADERNERWNAHASNISEGFKWPGVDRGLESNERRNDSECSCLSGNRTTTIIAENQELTIAGDSYHWMRGSKPPPPPVHSDNDIIEWTQFRVSIAAWWNNLPRFRTGNDWNEITFSCLEWITAIDYILSASRMLPHFVAKLLWTEYSSFFFNYDRYQYLI